mgnify:CR=1 FL=1
MADIIDRSAAQSLIPPELVHEIIQGATRYSVALQIFKRGRNMLRDEVLMPALSMLPEGGWLNSDNAIKPLTDQAWEMVEMYAEEYAARVIIPDNVREDAVFDMWGEILPRLQEHYGKAFDQAVFMGVNKPRRFRADLVTACYQAGAVVNSTTNINNDINNALSLVEQSGYNPTALVAGVGMKAKFRMNVDTQGRPVYFPFIEQLNKYYLDNGAWDDNKALMIVGDFSQAMYSVREDMTVKISADAATNYGGQLHSMFDEDSQVMRAKWRIGFAIPNPINILNQTNSRFPFAIIKNPNAQEPPTMYDVTFTATDSESNPVQGVTVKFAGSNIKTDSNGQAVFKSQGNQEYIYQIRYRNQLIKNGSVSIASSNVSVPVTIN